MIRLGAFEDADRYELLDGQLMEKMAQNEPHWWGMKMVSNALRAIFGSSVVEQVPLFLAEGDNPEPDASVLSPLTPSPTAEEILLVVEVADTSLATDLGLKARLFARHGVRDYWVLDLVHRELVVHRGPLREGERWTEIRRLGPEASVAPLAAPDRMILVEDLFRTSVP